MQNIITRLKNGDKFNRNHVSINAVLQAGNEYEYYIELANNYLKLGWYVHISLDEIRDDVIAMFELMVTMCSETELSKYLSEIYDYTSEQLPVIKKLDGRFWLIHDPKSKDEYKDMTGYSYTDEQMKQLCDFLKSDDRDKIEMQLCETPRRMIYKTINGIWFYVDFGSMGDYICPLTGISVDKLVAELPKLIKAN